MISEAMTQGAMSLGVVSVLPCSGQWPHDVTADLDISSKSGAPLFFTPTRKPSCLFREEGPKADLAKLSQSSSALVAGAGVCAQPSQACRRQGGDLPPSVWPLLRKRVPGMSSKSPKPILAFNSCWRHMAAWMSGTRISWSE